MVSNGGVIGKASGLGTGTTPAQTTAITSSGDFTTTSGSGSIEADVLVVGGGGGAGNYCGGAGAGGLCYDPGRNLTKGTAYEITIGAGGAGTGSHTDGLAGNITHGSDTTFDNGGTTITAEGGGFAFDDWCGQGGSGGGGGDGGNTSGTDYPSTVSGYPGESYGASTQGDSGGAEGFGNAGGPGVEDLGAGLGGGAVRMQ